MSPTVPPRLPSRIHKPSTSTPPRCKIPPPAALSYRRPSTYPPRQHGWFAAITPGPTKTYTSTRRKACLRLSPECPRSPLDPRFGSLSTITALSLNAYTPGKPWAPLRLSLSPIHRHRRLLLAHTANLLSPRTCHRPNKQLKALFQEFNDIISQGEDDLGCTPLLQHTIKTKGPLLRQPHRRQNPTVHREEIAQVQQMLSSGIIRPFNSPWASPVVMVKKKDGSLRFCVNFRQLNTATVKDAHLFPASTTSLTHYMGLAGSPPST